MSATPPLMVSDAAARGGQDAEELMSFHLLADCVERQDTLIMEIRHLQTNLIYTMRFPELHAALRFEESFIFGAVETHEHDPQDRQKGWSWLFGERCFRSPRTSIPELAEAFVPVLPVRDDEKNFQMRFGDLDERGTEHAFPQFHRVLDVAGAWRDAVAPITRALRRRALSGQWDDTFETHYGVFAALQALKRDVVHDKLHVAWHGMRAFAPGAGARFASDPTDEPDRGALRGDFLLARSVALGNMAMMVSRLADYHAHFEKTLDIGLQENHRPITGRRREQGVYHHVLGERARDLFIDTSRLVRRLLREDHSDKLYRGLPIFIHRWDHSYTSRNAELLGLSRSSRLRRDGGRTSNAASMSRQYPSFATFAVNTSFWMPDRPDLQPVIAHEAAHCVLVELFGDMDEPIERSGLDAPLTDLWRALMASKAAALKGVTSPADHANHHSEMREIMTDILAATVTGPGYLFALFQELLGNTVGRIAERSDWRGWRDLGELERIIEEGASTRRVALFWYTRLLVVADVVRATLPESERTPLTKVLIDGVIECVERLYHRLHKLRRDEDAVEMLDWSDYAKGLCVRIRMSGALSELLRFRTENGPLNQVDDRRVDPEPRRQTRDHRDETARGGALTEQTRRRLVEFIVSRKAGRTGRAAHAFLNDAALSKSLVDEHKPGSAGNGTTLPKGLREWLGTVPKLDPAGTAEDDAMRRLGEDPLAAADAVIAFHSLYVSSDEAALHRLVRLRTKIEKLGPRGEEADGKARALLRRMLGEVAIFHQLGDIPWQSSLFRAMDLHSTLRSRIAPRRDLGGDAHASTRAGWRLFETLSNDFAPGRETMQLAIEAWGFHRRSSLDPLGEVTRMTMNLVDRPVGDVARSQDAHGAPRRILEEIVDDLIGPATPTQAEAPADARLRELAESWRAQEGAPAHRLAKACAAAMSKARSPQREAVKDALKVELELWLGAYLDADFAELELTRDLWRRRDADLREPPFRAHAALALAQALRTATQTGASKLLGRVEKAALHEAADAKARVGAVDELRIWLSQAPKLVSAAAAANCETLLELTRVDFWRTENAAIPAYDPSADEARERARAAARDPRKALMDFTFAPPVRRMSDNIVQTLRVFEIAWLIELFAHLRSDDAFEWTARAALEKAGALQLLKLDRSYPDWIMPMKIGDRRPFVDCARFQEALTRHLHGSAPSAGRRMGRILEALAGDATTPATTLVTSMQSRGGRGRSAATMADMLLVAAAGGRVLNGRLERIARHAPQAMEAGFKLFAAATRSLEGPDAAHGRLDQAKARPVPRRHHLELRAARRVQRLVDLRLEALSPVVAPMLANSVQFGPIRSLLDLQRERGGDAARDGSSETLRDVFMGLDRPGPGLRGFHSLQVSRVSLIDAHWWRELGGALAESGDRTGDRTAAHGGVFLPNPVEGESGQRRTAVLGRYDFFLFTESPLLGQVRLPVLDPRAPQRREDLFTSPGRPFSKLKDEYGFRSFFERREQALSVALGPRPAKILSDPIRRSGETSDLDLLAIVSVRLDRRASRMGFVSRLRQACRAWRAFETQGPDAPGAAPFASDRFRESLSRSLERAVRTNPRLDLLDEAQAQRFAAARDRVFAEPDTQAAFEALLREEPKASPYRALIGSRRDEPGAAADLRGRLDCTRCFGDLPLLSVETLGPLLGEGDFALLGEGWGDLYLMVFAPMDPGPDQSEVRSRWLAEGAQRLFDVFAIQHTLFQDHQVHRTEMFLRPVAIPFAAADPKRFSLSLAVRTREDRELDGQIQRMIDVARDSILATRSKEMSDWERLKAAQETASIYHIPGRNDLEFHIADLSRIASHAQGAAVTLSDLSPSAALEAIHDLVGAGDGGGGAGSEEILTRIGFRHFPGALRPPDA